MKRNTKKTNSTKGTTRRAKTNSMSLIYAIIFAIIIAIAAILASMSMNKPNVTNSDAKEPSEVQNPAGDIPFPSIEDLSSN